MEGEFEGPEQFRAHIVKCIELYEESCKEQRKWVDDKDLIMNLVGTTMAGLPVRPKIIKKLKDGEKVYAFNLKQCKKLVEAIDEALRSPREPSA